jgi:hypothetical protein
LGNKHGGIVISSNGISSKRAEAISAFNSISPENTTIQLIAGHKQASKPCLPTALHFLAGGSLDQLRKLYYVSAS